MIHLFQPRFSVLIHLFNLIPGITAARGKIAYLAFNSLENTPEAAD